MLLLSMRVLKRESNFHRSDLTLQSWVLFSFIQVTLLTLEYQERIAAANIVQNQRDKRSVGTWRNSNIFYSVLDNREGPLGIRLYAMYWRWNAHNFMLVASLNFCVTPSGEYKGQLETKAALDECKVTFQDAERLVEDGSELRYLECNIL